MRLDLSIVAAALLVGCGHPATVTECEEIVERIARLELKKVYGDSPEELHRKTDSTKRQLRDSMMKECVGKRITDKAMQCVRTAEKSEQILEQCLPFSGH